MVTPLSKIPKELRGLWRVQYAPRERHFYKKLGKKAMAKYSKMSYIQKMHLLDRIQSSGYFDS